MNENIDFIVLEHDDGAGCALIAATVEGAVPAIDGYNTPYIVAEGYDHAARDWEDCRLFDDIGKAKLAYEKLRGRDYSLDADMPDSIAFRAKHSDIGTDDYRAKDFYKNAYRLIDDSYTAIAWRSEDRSLVYLAVADRGNELSVLHFPASALEELDSPALSHEDLFNVLGAVQDLHVGNAYAESDAVAEFARTSLAAASFRRSVLVWARDGELDLEVVKRFATDPYAREKRAIRGLPDAQLESEIAKAAAALDSKPRHLRSPELQHRSVMLRIEKARRLHESRSREMEKGGRDPQPWPPRPRRPRLSTAAAPSSTEATSISKPAAGNASRRPIR